MKRLVLLLTTGLVAGGVWVGLRGHPGADAGPPTQARPGTPTDLVAIDLPDSLSPRAESGRAGFEARCAACHGANGVGRDGAGPPLIHRIYEPSHHADEAFQRAVANGVRSHHWRFGDMPPQAGLTRAEVAMIVAYVREVQKANGIE